MLTTVDIFKYLGSSATSDDGIHLEINNSVQTVWMYGIVCDKRLSTIDKGKAYKITARPAMLCAQQQDLSAGEWTCGVTKIDRSKNEKVSETVKLTDTSKKI